MSNYNTKRAAFAVAYILFIAFPINQSLAINHIISTVQSSDIDISAQSSLSTISLDNGGVLNGNILMGNSSQITILNGGTLNGNISGAGKVNVGANSNLNGNIDVSGVVAIASGATLAINGGSIISSIRGAADNVGGVKFNANNTIFASLGTASTTLQLIEIANNSTLNTSDKTINTLALKINAGSTINYGGGDIVGSVKGLGRFIFAASDTTNFDIIESVNELSQTEKLAEIKINDGAIVSLGKNITATTINIGNGSSGTLRSKGNLIEAENINIASGATLDFDLNSVILGNINGVAAGVGMVQFSNSKAGYVQNQSLGENNKLAEILISNETTIILENAVLNADSISIGEGGATGVIASVLTQNSGSIGFDENSLIKLNTNAIFNYNGGTINGVVRGTSSGKGDFNINASYTNNSKIGASGSLANLNIASGKTLAANADIAANNISLAGTLDLGSSNKQITGNLTTIGGTSLINLGSASHKISGNFTTLSGDVLKLNALSSSKIGNLEVAGNSTIADGLVLEISFDANDGYLSNGTNFAIISSNSGEVNVVSDVNINVNNSGSNQLGLLTFHTAKSGNNLLLSVDRKGAQAFSNNQFVAKIYQNIDKVGANATGELRDLQKIIDNNFVSDANKESALKSTIPQNNQDLNNSSFNLANSSLNVVNDRLQNSVLGVSNLNNSRSFFNFQNSHNLFAKRNLPTFDKLNFEEQIFDNQAIWLQGFNTSAKQENVGDNEGYDYSNQGLAIGVDQEISQNLRVGISSSVIFADVKSNISNQKQTNIDSYQFNLYGGYNFAPYFVSGILGLAINQYNSIRSMPEFGLQAKAKYGGETYIGKFEIGNIKDLNYDLIFTPKLSLTLARNQIDSYEENGAGTLNLGISNEHANFLEGRVGFDLLYQGLKIIKPQIKLSYGYDFLNSDQSSTNHFQGQSSSFQIKNSNIDKSSFKYGVGLNIYQKAGFLLDLKYDVEVKSSYKSKVGSVYLRYDF